MIDLSAQFATIFDSVPTTLDDIEASLKAIQYPSWSVVTNLRENYRAMLVARNHIDDHNNGRGGVNFDGQGLAEAFETCKQANLDLVQEYRTFWSTLKVSEIYTLENLSALTSVLVELAKVSEFVQYTHEYIEVEPEVPQETEESQEAIDELTA